MTRNSGSPPVVAREPRDADHASSRRTRRVDSTGRSAVRTRVGGRRPRAAGIRARSVRPTQPEPLGEQRPWTPSGCSRDSCASHGTLTHTTEPAFWSIDRPSHRRVRRSQPRCSGRLSSRIHAPGRTNGCGLCGRARFESRFCRIRPRGVRPARSGLVVPVSAGPDHEAETAVQDLHE